MPYSYLSHLYCPKTGEHYDAERIQQLSQVGAPLLVAYDLQALKERWKPADLIGREASLWRYHELLPVRDPAHVVSLGEDRKSTRLNSSHVKISYAVFCLKKKNIR